VLLLLLLQAAVELLRDSVLPSLTDASAQHSRPQDFPLGFQTGGEVTTRVAWLQTMLVHAAGQAGWYSFAKKLCRTWIEVVGAIDSWNHTLLWPLQLLLRPCTSADAAGAAAAAADPAVDELAMLLRILYIKDLRSLQSAIDRMLVQVQVRAQHSTAQ
jgi:hypothetical protein